MIIFDKNLTRLVERYNLSEKILDDNGVKLYTEWNASIDVYTGIVAASKYDIPKGKSANIVFSNEFIVTNINGGNAILSADMFYNNIIHIISRNDTQFTDIEKIVLGNNYNSSFAHEKIIDITNSLFDEKYDSIFNESMLDAKGKESLLWLNKNGFSIGNSDISIEYLYKKMSNFTLALFHQKTYIIK